MQERFGALNLKEVQRGAKDPVLQLRVIRLAERVAVGERHEKAARRFYLYRHLA